MCNVLLRKMTLKSIIGFGEYKLLTVQELMNLQKHKELLRIYYNLEKIDFDDEVKRELFLDEFRQIPKPGKDYSAYRRNVGKILFDIIDFNRSYAIDNPYRFFKLQENKANKNRQVINNCIRQNKENCKVHNRERNQNH